MSNSIPDPTIDYYDTNAALWEKLHNKQDFWEEPLQIFRELVPEGSTVLEIGFGPARDAINLINAGYKYIGIDPSQAMVELAGIKDLYGQFIQMSVEELDLSIINNVDSVWTVAVLIHLFKSMIKEVLIKIRKTMKEGAIAFITMKKYVDTDGSPDERFETDQFGTRFFAYWTEEEFTKVLEESGFTLIRKVQEEYVSSKTTWLKFFVKKVTES